MTADTAATAALGPDPITGSGPGATADDTTISWADFRTWEDQLTTCSHPIQLRGRIDAIDVATGELVPVYDSTAEPSGVLHVACGNRRETVCPACSQVYKRDARQLVRAGLTGGKGIPGTITAHPCVFATLTAPSFGPVHARRMRGKTVLPCRPRRDGLPVSPQTTWQILDAEGIGRLPRRDEGRRGPPGRLDVIKAVRLRGWPADPVSLPCHHAGLLLLFPAMAELGLPALVRTAGYPSTRQLSSWQSVGSLLLAKCARQARIHHAGSLGDDAGLAFTLGLTALPKATHLGTYSWRVRRECNRKLLAGLVAALRPLELATGEAGFNCDFHAIRHHGTEAVLEKHYVPRRSQRTRAILTFFAQDHASAEMVYANADITKAEQAGEIIAFADYWQQATGTEPGMLVFDSQLTTYKILEQLTGRGIAWLTLRQRGKNELERLAALPASAWKTVTIARAGRYRRPRLHEDMVKIKDISSRVRQIAVTGIGRDEPTLLITHDLATPARDLFARYAERMMVENELDAYIGGFHLDALTSGVPLNVDLDTTLTVVAGNLYRLLALKLDRYEQATPDKIWRDFLEATGTLHIGPESVTCALNLRSHHPVLIDAGFADLQVPIPWWHNRTLQFRFPPR